MNNLFLRLGIDTGSGGALAPIFEDGTFEYIPIPEKAATDEEKIYSEMNRREHESIEKFVPDQIKYYQPHLTLLKYAYHVHPTIHWIFKSENPKDLNLSKYLFSNGLIKPYKQ